MKYLRLILIGILIIHASLILYTNRALFFSHFDEAYWKDKYEHSQWKLPLSLRTLGDDGLYLYEGWRLIHGGDPSTVNAEMPPLGKYVIGATTLFLDNGHWFGALSTLSVLAMFFLLANRLLKSKLWALAATTLLATDPLLTSQFTLTMLDSLQLLFLLGYFYFLTQAVDSQLESKHVLLAGFFLGGLAATKFPILVPLLATLGSLVLWKAKRRLYPIATLLGAAGAIYTLSYLQYFLLGHSLREWLGLQKWMWWFYRHQSASPNIGSALTTLLWGRSQNLFSRSWEVVAGWGGTWPLVTILGIIWFFTTLRQRMKLGGSAWWILALFTIATLLFYTFIPFWTRYLLLILPFLYLGTIAVLVHKQIVAVFILVPLLLVNWSSSLPTLFPSPRATLTQFTYAWQNGFFQDLYEHLTKSSGVSMDRASFHRFIQGVLRQGEIEDILIEVTSTPRSHWRSPQTARLRVRYSTRNLGAFTEEKDITLLREDGQWRIPWQWDYLLDGFVPGMLLETSIEMASRGKIIDSDNQVLAADFPSLLVWVTPQKVDRVKEVEMLRFLEKLFRNRFTPDNFHIRYTGNSQPDWPVPLGVIPQPINEDTKGKLLAFPGITLTPQTGRFRQDHPYLKIGIVYNSSFFECCSLLYSTTNYDGLTGIEKEKNNLLKGYNGGQLVIKNAQGRVVRPILKLDKKDGQDVQL